MPRTDQQAPLIQLCTLNKDILQKASDPGRTFGKEVMMQNTSRCPNAPDHASVQKATLEQFWRDADGSDTLAPPFPLIIHPRDPRVIFC